MENAFSSFTGRVTELAELEDRLLREANELGIGPMGFGGATTLRGAVATGYRAPSIDELYGDYSAFGFNGNPALEPETSVTAEIGVDHVYASGAEVSATTFAWVLLLHPLGSVTVRV